MTSPSLLTFHNAPGIHAAAQAAARCLVRFGAGYNCKGHRLLQGAGTVQEVKQSLMPSLFPLLSLTDQNLDRKLVRLFVFVHRRNKDFDLMRFDIAQNLSCFG